VSSVDETLDKLVSRGYPLASEAEEIHAGLQRLRTMLDREIDEAEALQAAGEWTFVAEQAPPADRAARADQIESEDDHDA
jgi:Arc/MetJ-type ribon-helix-helix transcriptional regulator